MEQQMLIPFRVNRAHHNLQFFVAHDRVAALRVQFGDQVAQRRDQRVGLRNDLVALQAEVAVQLVLIFLIGTIFLCPDLIGKIIL